MPEPALPVPEVPPVPAPAPVPEVAPALAPPVAGPLAALLDCDPAAVEALELAPETAV